MTRCNCSISRVAMFVCLSVLMALSGSLSGQVKVVYMADEPDDFGSYAESSPLETMREWMLDWTSSHAHADRLTGFDDFPIIGGQGLKPRPISRTVNGVFGHAFTDLPPNIIGAELEMGLVAGEDNPRNDGIGLQFTGPGTHPQTATWRYDFVNLPESGGSWYTGSKAVFTLDIDALPKTDGSFVSLIDSMNERGYLDLYIHDETGVDYLKLTLTLDYPVCDNLAVNPGFEVQERIAYLPNVYGIWSTDYFSFASAENGITPPDGLLMWKAESTRWNDYINPDVTTACEVMQVVDITDYLELIEAGDVVACLSALFNRIQVDHQTDTLMGVVMRNFDGPVSSHGTMMQNEQFFMRGNRYIMADSDINTWERTTAVMPLHTDTNLISIQISTNENIYNDTSYPEFDGHYADQVTFCLKRAGMINFSTVSPAITVDADAGESAWSAAGQDAIFRSTVSPAPATSDLFGLCRSVADPDFLYLYIDVTDDVLVTDNPAESWWQDDSVMICIDSDNSRGDACDGRNDYRLGFRVNDPQLHYGPGSIQTLPGAQFATAERPGGYRIEVKLPWLSLRRLPLAGEVMGFEIVVNDDDDGGNADGHVRWLENNGDPMPAPDAMGVVKLKYMDAIGYEMMVIDDIDARLNYAGNWVLQTGWSGRIDQTTHETSDAGAAASISFTGPTVSLIADQQPWGGTAAVYVDSVFVQDVSFYSETPDAHQQVIFSADDLARTSHVLELVAAGDGWVYIDGVALSELAGMESVDDADGTVSYSGSWTARTGWSGRVNMTTHETDQAGSAAIYTFTGPAVSVIGEKQPWGGSAAVYIDNEPAGTISYHSETTQYQQEVFSAAGLAGEGRHTIRLVADGNGWVYIDAVESLPQMAGLYDNTDAAISSDPNWIVRGDDRHVCGSSLETSVDGAQLFWLFTGSGFSIIAEKQPWGGQAEVFVDGDFVQTIDFFSPAADQYQQVIYECDDLTPGFHSVKMQKSGGGWVYLDAVQYLP